MSEFAFRTCLESIESDDYAAFKENYELVVSREESEYLLRASISHGRKFIVEYLAEKIDLSEGQLKDCQIFSSTGEDLSIFKLFSKKLGLVCTQAWMNIFNMRTVSDIQGLIECYGKPEEDLQPIIQYALANNDPQVHAFAFDQLFDNSLLDNDEKKQNMIDSICFSGNLDLLDKLEGVDELKKAVNDKQEAHVAFASRLDSYVELVFQNTPKEKVAQTVNTLGIMEEIRANPQVEDWDIIIQDYLVNEELTVLDGIDEIPSESEKVRGLLENKELMLLELVDVKPSEYRLVVKNTLGSSEEFDIALDRRVFDQGALYVAYVVQESGQFYISSHPMFILKSKLSLLKLSLRKEKDRKQQQANKKKSKGKKSSSKVKLSTKETFKILLSEHIKSRKEIDDNV